MSVSDGNIIDVKLSPIAMYVVDEVYIVPLDVVYYQTTTNKVNRVK